MIDLCNGYGALLLGHKRPEIISAVAKQLERGTLYCAPTREETILAQRIKKLYPSMHQTRLVNTGGEATMTAIRLARGFTGKKKIVTFEGCYHGAHDSVLVRAGSGQAHRGISVSAGVLDEVSENTLVAKYNDPSSLAEILDENDDIACVIIEPVPANMGPIPPKRGFLKKVRSLTKSRGVLLIFDEVVTGFRVSAGGAQARYGVRPDMTTLAKALGGGFGIAAVGGRRDIMSSLAPRGPVYQASTFAGNPIATSAALAFLDVIERKGKKLYCKLENNCIVLAKTVADAAEDAKVHAEINHVSSMMQIFFTKGMVTDYSAAAMANAAKFQTMFAELLRQGVFVAPSHFEAVFISDAHMEQDMARIGEAYRTAIKKVKDCDT